MSGVAEFRAEASAVEALGSTGSIQMTREGVVLKKPWDFKTDVFIRETIRSFSVERCILSS